MSQTASPIGVGIAGLSANGGWAATAHVPALAALPGFELRALSASSTESARAAGDRYGIPLAFGTVEELVERDEVDLVVVVVKVPHHRELVTAALHAGKMVLCEWPLGTGLAEAEAMARLAEDRGLRTVVGLQTRCAPVIRYLRDLVAQGYVGEVNSTTVVASGLNWGPTFHSSRTYQLDRDTGGTMLGIPFGHTVDVLTMVLGEFTDLTATTATRHPLVRDVDTGQTRAMTAEDQIAVSGTLDSGAVAAIHYRGGRSRGTNFRWEINGTDGDLVVTVDPPLLQLGHVRLHGAHGADTALAELPIPDSYHLADLVAGAHTAAVSNVAHSYAQFLGDLTEGTRESPDFGHGVRRHRLLDQIQRAAAVDHAVRVIG